MDDLDELRQKNLKLMERMQKLMMADASHVLTGLIVICAHAICVKPP